MKMYLARFFAIFCLSLPAVTHAWWNDDWSFRKAITVDKSALEAQPVLVRLHPGNFTFFSDLLPNAEDLRFVAGDDKTLLKHHIEKFDPANGMALVWVALPAERASAERIYMYYGNAKAAPAADVAGTYDRSFAAVYHFAAAEPAQDETANANRAATFSALPNPASLIGEGVKFDGHGVVRIAPSATFAIDPAAGWTWSAWIRIEAPQQEAYIMQAQEGVHSLGLVVSGATVEARYAAEGATARAVSSAALTMGTWHHVALALGKGRLAVYLDGAETGSAPAAAVAMQPTLSLGAAAEGGHGLVGDMDEAQVSGTVRSPAWLAAQARMQGMDSTALSYGADESRDSGANGSYFKVILQNVTVDGWVVIVLLMVMAALSWVVMLAKGLVIGRTRKNNADFLDRFRAAGGTEALDEKQALPSPDSDSRFRNSTVYRLYHTGCQELGKRTAHAAGAQAASLTPQALDAIRAALDATLVRETQKLNGQMVLLTIAISGGPFLGLLGTVVGVMITFAAIAASGDVNVNAIAPGIAAALVATVAGLAVAIPALFGYNYLASRIKEITADMRVFVDEFVTRLAELHA